MAEPRITWEMAHPFLWRGNVGEQTWFLLCIGEGGNFALKEPYGGDRTLAVARGIASLKDRAEQLLQDAIDQGLPLE